RNYDKDSHKPCCTALEETLLCVGRAAYRTHYYGVVFVCCRRKNTSVSNRLNSRVGTKAIPSIALWRIYYLAIEKPTVGETAFVVDWKAAAALQRAARHAVIALRGRGG
ncbi:unnamed protein product, partial [Laminaria digitata]